MQNSSNNQKTRKQHYVPQFYLRQWVDNTGGFFPVKIENRNPPRLNVFRQKSGTSSFCFENYFYAEHTGVKDEVSQIIEASFAETEALFSNKLPEIEKKIVNNEHINNSEKYILAQCMIFLHFRGKKYLDQSKRMTSDVTKEMMKHWVHYIDKNPKSNKSLIESGITKEEMIEFVYNGEFTVDYGNTHHLQIMEEMQGFSNLLYAKYWKVFISRSGQFITTDAPYLDLPTSKHFFGNDFLSREQVFALSPRVVIFAVYPKSDIGKKIKRKDITSNEGLIQIINSHLLMNSISFGFHKDRDFLIRLTSFVGLQYEWHQKNTSVNRDFEKKVK